MIELARIQWPEGFDEEESRMKGYVVDARALLSDGHCCSVSLSCVERIASELRLAVASGENWIPESGLIVGSDATVKTMTAAIKSAVRDGLFGALRPIPSN